MAQNYKNAFKCDKCPGSNDENGCPAWNEVVMTNISNQEIKVLKGCNFYLMPLLLQETIKVANRPAAAVIAMRDSVNESLKSVADGLGVLGEIVRNRAIIPTGYVEIEETKGIENAMEISQESRKAIEDCNSNGNRRLDAPTV